MPDIFTASSGSARRGLILALSGFSLWGLFPLYFKLLDQIPAIEVLAHRILWSVFVLAALIAFRGLIKELRQELRERKHLSVSIAATLFLSGNWLLYIWSVQNNRVLEASLGYYINPLVSVMLGMLFLHERLNLRQGLAVALATSGVLYLIIGYGTVPWISLALAFSFGSYGLLRKKAGMNTILGLFMETLLLAPIAAVYLGYLAFQDQGGLGHSDLLTTILLLCAGAVTVAPLILFLESMHYLRLSTVGILQYVTPTLQFLLAVLVFHEPFTRGHQVTFALIWLAVVVYSLDALLSARQSPDRPLA